MKSSTNTLEQIEIRAANAAADYRKMFIEQFPGLPEGDMIRNAFQAGAAFERNNLAISDVRLHCAEEADRVIGFLDGRYGMLREHVGNVIEAAANRIISNVKQAVGKNSDYLGDRVARELLQLREDTGKGLGQLDGTLDDLQLEVLGVRNLVEAVHGLKADAEEDAAAPRKKVERVSVSLDADSNVVVSRDGSASSVDVVNPFPYGVYHEPGEFGEGATVTKSGISREAFDKYVKSVNDAYWEDQKRPPLRPGQMSGLDVVLNDQGVDALIARDLRDHGAAFIAVRADGTRKVFDPRDVIIQVKPSS